MDQATAGKWDMQRSLKRAQEKKKIIYLKSLFLFEGRVWLFLGTQTRTNSRKDNALKQQKV